MFVKTLVLKVSENSQKIDFRRILFKQFKLSKLPKIILKNYCTADFPCECSKNFQNCKIDFFSKVTGEISGFHNSVENVITCINIF